MAVVTPRVPTTVLIGPTATALAGGVPSDPQPCAWQPRYLRPPSATGPLRCRELSRDAAGGPAERFPPQCGTHSAEMGPSHTAMGGSGCGQGGCHAGAACGGRVVMADCSEIRKQWTGVLAGSHSGLPCTTY